MRTMTGILVGACVVILCTMAAARIAVGAVVAAIVHGFGRGHDRR